MKKESIDNLLSMGFTDATEQYASFSKNDKHEVLDTLSDKLISMFGDGEVISFRGQKCAIKFKNKQLTVGLLFKSEYGSVSYNGFTNLLGKKNEKVIRSCDDGKWRSRKTYEPDMDFIIPVIRWDCLSYPKTILKKDDIIVLSEDETPFKFMTYLKAKPSGPDIFEGIIMFCPVEKKFALLHRHKTYQMNNGSLICPSYSIKYISDCEFNENIFGHRNFSEIYHKVPVIKEKTSFFEYKKTIYFASGAEIKLLKNRYYEKGYRLSIYPLEEARVSLDLNQRTQSKSIKDLESEISNDYKVYEQKKQKEIKEMEKRRDEWWRLSLSDFDTFIEKSLSTRDKNN